MDDHEFHPEAELELLEAPRRYESIVPGLGERLGDEVERVVDLLLENPNLGASLEDNLRHFVLRRFPFTIICAVVDEMLSILAVAHGSREPGYGRLELFRRRCQRKRA